MRYFEFKTTTFPNFRFCVGAHTYSEAQTEANKAFECVRCIGIVHPYVVKESRMDVIQIPYKDKIKLYPEHIEVRI